MFLPLIRLHSVRQHVTQSPVPFSPGPIMEHNAGDSQGILRGSSGITDIDITFVIIRPKLAKWIANLRGFSHSILVCACLPVRTSGFVKSTVTIRFRLWLSVFLLFSPLCVSSFIVRLPLSHNLPKNSISYYTDIDRFLGQTFALEKKRQLDEGGWTRRRCLSILEERRSNRQWGLDL